MLISTTVVTGGKSVKQEIVMATVKGALGSIPLVGGLLSEYAGLPSSIKQEKIFIEMQMRLQNIELAYEEFSKEIAEKLNLIPEAKFAIPPVNIFIPIIEASKIYIEDRQMRAMFTELLSKSMNEDTVDFAHVSFVEIIKQLSPFDAKFIKAISERASSKYLGNSFLPLANLMLLLN